jgi:hypothetical protein
LLGGSFARNLHTETSDIDFYIVPKTLSQFKHVFKYKHTIKIIKHKYLGQSTPPPHIPITIHITFPFFLQKYFYHVSGIDIHNKWMHSNITKRALRYNTIKQIIRNELHPTLHQNKSLQKKLHKQKTFLSNINTIHISKDLFFFDKIKNNHHSIQYHYKKQRFLPKPLLLILFFTFEAIRKKHYKKAYNIFFQKDIKQALHILSSPNQQKKEQQYTYARSYFFWWPIF